LKKGGKQSAVELIGDMSGALKRLPPDLLRLILEMLDGEGDLARCFRAEEGEGGDSTTMRQAYDRMESLTLREGRAAGLTAHFPPFLKELTCVDWSTLPAVASLPATLRVFRFSRTREPDGYLPQGLQVLEIDGGKGGIRLRALPSALPSALTHLACRNCDMLFELPAQLPGGLVHLDVSGCVDLHSLPQSLPDGLLHLSCGGTEEMEDGVMYLERLPPRAAPGLTFLDCSYNRDLKSIPPLPPMLEYLVCIDFSAGLVFPTSVPASLTYLSLEDCKVIKPRGRADGSAHWSKGYHVRRVSRREGEGEREREGCSGVIVCSECNLFLHVLLLLLLLLLLHELELLRQQLHYLPVAQALGNASAFPRPAFVVPVRRGIQNESASRVGNLCAISSL